MGWGTARALNYSQNISKIEIAQTSTQENNNTLEISKTKYIEKCGSCHLPMPAEVLPVETWQQLLKKPKQHYGTSLTQLDRLSTSLVWNYLNTVARPLLPNEALPYLVEDARYFKALHPQVKLPQPTTHQTCLACHPNAAKMDYQTIAEGQ